MNDESGRDPLSRATFRNVTETIEERIRTGQMTPSEVRKLFGDSSIRGGQ